MAARKNLTHTDKTRERIKASMLLNRLEKFVEGEVELTAPQVTAALGLLKKVVPDLQAVSLEGSVDHKVVGEVVFKGLNA
jgi:hypothetical protein